MQQYTFSRNILYSSWTMDKQEEYIQRYTKVRREEFHPTWTFYSSLKKVEINTHVIPKWPQFLPYVE